MTRQQAAVLIAYMNRSQPIIPTTGSEWEVMRMCFPILEGIANGLVTCEIVPVVKPDEIKPGAQSDDPPKGRRVLKRQP